MIRSRATRLEVQIAKARSWVTLILLPPAKQYRERGLYVAARSGYATVPLVYIVIPHSKSAQFVNSPSQFWEVK